MGEVQNLNLQIERKPPPRFDDEVYNYSEDLTADINEIGNINRSMEWKE